MNFIRLTFNDLSPETADIVAAVLDGAGSEGFEIQETILYAYFKESQYNEAAVRQWTDSLGLNFTSALIPEENWNKEWESNYEPILIGNEVYVKAHFHLPLPGYEYQIEITPKMSFGTGHHATTQMMLEYGCETDFREKEVLDFGCGTGILAIFASMKKALSVVAIDHDPWALENTRENCEKNNCANVKISPSDINILTGAYDIILANINLNILLESLPAIYRLLKPGGDLFISGLLESDREKILSEYTKKGFREVSSKSEKGWIAIHFHKP